jgi:2-succinyl-5-enolpyruvyl-6-hydroxy-3-cyclohexene-1-carboxylate synthase
MSLVQAQMLAQLLAQMTSNSPAQAFAANLLAALAKAGVREFYLAPGARSQALAIAAGQLASAGKINLHVRLDERSLAFNALGSAMTSGEPAVIITTSGTAVANLHPAVLEASHSGIPLILLTADRPHELRGVGANQTTNQVGIFGDAVRECVDQTAPTGADGEADEAIALAVSAIEIALGFDGDQPGPVQLNLAFREPLSALEPDAAKLNPRVMLGEQFEPRPDFAVLDSSVPTVVLAGANAGEDAVELAESFGWPLFAEPSSGARFGANAISNYRHHLDHQTELASRIGRVVVFGKPTLSRSVLRLMQNEAVEVVVVRSQQMGFFDVARRAAFIVDEVSVTDEVDFEWLAEWRAADTSDFVSGQADSKITRPQLVHEVWAATEATDRLMLGASRLIREADQHAPAKAIAVFANRGLAGIDGTIATATGIAQIAARDGFGGQTRVLIGDLTLLHDAGSLAYDQSDVAHAKLNIQLVVGNDHGGSIFKGLEMAKTLDAATFTKLFATPQSVDMWHLAAAYGWQYLLVETVGELETALASNGRIILDVRLAD